MAEVKWIKIVTDIFDDEKILLIEQMPDGYAIITTWFKLLCLAGKQNNSGVFTINNKIPYTDEMFASIFRMQLSTVRLALATFEKFDMVQIINNTVTIPNWGKHQSLDKITQRNEYMRKYMSSYREKQKAIADNSARKTNSKSNRKVNVSALEGEEEGELRIRSSSRADSTDDDSFSAVETASRRVGLPWHPHNQEKALALKTKYTEDWLLRAIDRVSIRDRQNWGLVEGILRSWKAQGFVDEPDSKPATQQSNEQPNWVVHHVD